jgi:hypothetical protein
METVRISETLNVCSELMQLVTQEDFSQCGNTATDMAQMEKVK